MPSSSGRGSGCDVAGLGVGGGRGTLAARVVRGVTGGMDLAWLQGTERMSETWPSGGIMTGLAEPAPFVLRTRAV